MAGHMGNTKVTKQNLSVVLIDEASNIIGVKGSVPGHKNAFVIINDAKKKSRPLNSPYPYAVKTAIAEPEVDASAS
jgi:large subunit ribosomal protein L3